MEFYLVVYGSLNSPDIGILSFSSKNKAIECASQIASNGTFSSNADATYISRAKVGKIIKFNAHSLRGVSCELTLKSGRFELNENKATKNS